MNAIRVDTTIDEMLARAVPALRPLLGRRVELIALDEAPAAPAPRPRLTVDELLASRIDLPAGVGPISLDDMERAIVEGALGHEVPRSGRAAGGAEAVMKAGSRARCQSWSTSRMSLTTSEESMPPRSSSRVVTSVPFGPPPSA